MPVANQMAKLVIDSQAGDVNSFNELYNLSAQDLKVVGYSILHKKEDVEDALQETYITIYRSFTGQGRSPLDKPESFLPWAKKIMKNTCLNQIALRKRKAGKDELRPMTTEDDQSGMDQIDNFDDDVDFSPEDVVETKYVRSLIDAALAEIPAVRQTCLALYQQGLTYREISEQLGLPEGTVKSHVRYAKLQLQKALREIEKKENVKLNGFTFIPTAIGLEYIVRIEEKEGGWISAELKDSTPASKAKKIGVTNFSRRTIAVILAILVAVSSSILTAVSTPQAETPTGPQLQRVEKSNDEQSNQYNGSNPEIWHSPKADKNSGTHFLKNQLRDGTSEFYNPNMTFSGNGVNIAPYHIWYQDGKMIADCYVANLESFTIINISVDELRINAENKRAADAEFGELSGVKIAPYCYVKHRFIFRKGTFNNVDLSDGIDFYANTAWNKSSDQNIPSDNLKLSTDGTGPVQRDLTQHPDLEPIEARMAVQIKPAYAKYEDDGFHFICLISNEGTQKVSDITVENLTVSNKDGKIAESSFGNIDLKLAPGEIKKYEFIFKDGTFEKDKSLTNLKCDPHITFNEN